MTRSPGFTLVELMTVLAIIGVLAAVALPSYLEHVQRSHRTQARAALVQAAQWMERAATAQGAYPRSDTSPSEIPDAVLQVQGGRYALTATSITGTSFLLTATPTALQAADPCAAFRLDHTGKRSQWATVAIPHPLSDLECWNR